MRRFGVKSLLLLMTVTVVATAVVFPWLEVRRAGMDKSASVRAFPKELPDPHFRLSVVYDLPSATNNESGCARVIAIEKHRGDSPHLSLLPSFSSLDVDHSNRSAVMYIEGRPVISTSELVVFMAEYGEAPKRVVIGRDDFNKVSNGSIMSFSSDLDFWELCVDAAQD